MDIPLDKSALFAAMEAFWQTEAGNDKGVEAAITAYIERMGLAPFNEMATARRAALATATARVPARPPASPPERVRRGRNHPPAPAT